MPSSCRWLAAVILTTAAMETAAMQDVANDEGEPLATARGALGEASVRVFDRGKPIGRRAIGQADAQKLVEALESFVRRSRAEDAPEGTDIPGRDQVLREGWTVELRYEIFVDQTKLGFVPENTTRAVDLNRFLIPLPDAPAKDGPRFHPYHAFRVDGRPALFDFSTQTHQIIRSETKLDDIRRILGELGVDPSPRP